MYCSIQRKNYLAASPHACSMHDRVICIFIIFQDIHIETLSEQTNQQLRGAFERFDKLAMVMGLLSPFHIFTIRMFNEFCWMMEHEIIKIEKILSSTFTLYI